MNSPIPQTAVIGVSGYAGAELARLLLRHPQLHDRPPVFFGRAGDDESARVRLTEIHPQLADNNGSAGISIEPFQWKALQAHGIDLVFLATPHDQSRAWVPQLLEHGVRVIDLSGAWRLRHSTNRAVYRFTDDEPARAEATQQEAVYGLPELHRAEIGPAKLVANPGCYATSVILALAPLTQSKWIDLDRGIVADVKSGVSGAGKTPTAKTHFMHAADNLSAYSVFGHRHTGELLEQLRLAERDIVFTPHLLPIPRGIFATVYLSLREAKSADEIDVNFRSFYAGSPMVRWFGSTLPEIQHSVRTNFCDIGFALAKDGRRLIVVTCLDNLLKGAAGQAVQNMNLLFGWREEEGLT